MTTGVRLNHSVKTRVTLVTLLVFVACLWTLAWYASMLLHRDMQQQQGAQQHTTVSLLASQVDDQIRTRLQALDVVAQRITSSDVQHGADLQARLNEQPVFLALFGGGVMVLDEDGIVQASAPDAPARVGQRVALVSADTLRLNQMTKATLARPMMGPFSKVPVVPMVAPLAQAPGAKKSWLVGVIDLQSNSFLDHVGRPLADQVTEFIVISRPHRLVVAATDRSRVLSASASPGADADIDQFIAGALGTRVMKSTRGIDVMVSVAMVASADWLLAGQLPMSEVFKPIAVLQQRLWLSAALLTLVAGALTWWFLRRELRPLVRAANMLAGVDAHDPLPSLVPSGRHDEIGLMIGAFNQLLGQLGHREQAIHGHSRALTQSNQRLQAILHSVPQMVWLKDPQGRYLICNARFEAFFGLPQTRLTGKTDADFFPPDLAQTYQISDQQCLQSKQLQVRQQWLASAAGGQRALVEISKIALRDEQGQPVAVLGIGQDVTASWHLTQFEQLRSHVLEMLAQDASLSALLQALADGLRVLQPDWQCLMWLVQSHTDQGPCFRLAASAGLPEEFIKAVNAMPVAEALGGCDGAVIVGSRMVVSNVATSPQWASHRDLATRFGIASSWSQPIRDAQGAFKGVFSVYHPKPVQPSKEDVNLLEQLTHLAEIATERHQSAQRLRASEQSFRALAEHTPEAVLVHANGRILYANPAAVRLFGAASAEALRLLKTQQLIAPSFLSQQLARMRAIQSGQSIEPMVESRFLRLDGTGFDVEVQGTSIVYGLVPAIHVSIRDITQRKQTQRQLHLAASVFEHALEGILITDASGTIMDVNTSFTRITGYARDDVVGQNPRVLQSGKHDRVFYKQLWHSLLQDGFWSGEMWNRRKSGRIYVQLSSITAVRNEQGEIVQFVGLFSDITVRKAQEDRLNNLAHFDALTGLPNRTLYSDRLRQAMAQTVRRHKKLGLAFVDLDGFKAVNDHFGHDAGDHVLVTLAQRMQQALREVDTLSRMGGDEFAAIIVDLEQEHDCDQLLQRLLAAANEPVLYKGHSLQVSASVGVTFFPQPHALSSEELLQQADQAMYRAKELGKNQYHISDFAGFQD